MWPFVVVVRWCLFSLSLVFFRFFSKKKNPNFWPSSFGTKMICWTFGIMKNEKKSEKKKKREKTRGQKKQKTSQKSIIIIKKKDKATLLSPRRSSSF